MDNVFCPSSEPVETPPVSDVSTLRCSETHSVVENVGGFSGPSHSSAMFTPIFLINPNPINCSQTRTFTEYAVEGAGSSYRPVETTPVSMINTHPVRHTKDPAGGAGPSHWPVETTPASNINTHPIRRTDISDQHNYAVTASPLTLKRTIDDLCDKLMFYRTELKRANKSIYRLKTKVSYLTSVVQSLREEVSPL